MPFEALSKLAFAWRDVAMCAFCLVENSLIQVIDLASDPIYLCNGIHDEYLCTVFERTHAHLQMTAPESASSAEPYPPINFITFTESHI